MSGQDPFDRVDGAPATLADLLALLRRGIELDLCVMAPATVAAYNPATQRADVTLGFLRVQNIEGQPVPLPPIVLPQVPVRFPGSQASYATCPVLPGTTGHVVFADRCLTQWLLTGVPSDPLNARTHALADAVFEPGLRPNTQPIVPPTDQTAYVIEGPLVKLGRGATQPLVLGTALSQAFAAWTAAVAAAGEAWGAVQPPTPISNGAFIEALVTATQALAGTIATWLSQKALTQ